MPSKVTVEATEERYRVLTHQPSGIPFNEDGRAEWPLDQFTYRLEAEGSVRIVKDDVASQDKPAGRPTDKPASDLKKS